MTYSTLKALTVFLVIWVLGLGSNGMSATASENENKIEAVFDLGSVSVAAEIRRTFAISNKSDDVLRIKKALCSSRLVQILSYPREIPANKNGDIELRLIPSEPGELKGEISFEAENPPNTVLHYALKGTVRGEIPGALKKRLDSDIPSELITRKLVRRDPAFSTSVETVLKKLKMNSDLVLVDVRSQGQFQKFRIPGSVNIPLFAVKAKDFLKKRSVVLVNDGYGCLKLEQECRTLRGLGFSDISVLSGGLNAWKQRGGALEGDVFAQRDLDLMPPPVFFEEKDDESLLMFDVSSPAISETGFILPYATAVPLSDDKKEFVSRLKIAMLKQNSTALSTVLIFNRDGSQYEKIEKPLQGSGITNVFYLQSGLDGYNKFLQNQALMWQSKEKRVKAINKCPTCP